MSSRLEILEQRLHDQDLPLTIQRRVIYETFETRTDHPTTDQIYESVRDRIPGVSRTTVYRVLETFVRIGMARKVGHPGSTVRFDPRTDHHHHLVCEECDKVVDVEPARGEKLPRPAGFEITDYSVHYRGFCAECRPKKRKR